MIYLLCSTYLTRVTRGTPFGLSAYKYDLLMPYSKMYFSLCDKAQFENSLSDEFSDEETAELLVACQCSSEQKAVSCPTTSATTSTDNSWKETHLDLLQGHKNNFSDLETAA